MEGHRQIFPTHQIVYWNDNVASDMNSATRAEITVGIGPWQETFPFQWPAEIVALHVDVIPGSSNGGALVAPTVADLLCDLSVNEGRKYCSTARDSDLAPGSSFASLAALSILAPRVISIPLAATSELAFELRWKRFTAGAPLYEDALVTISALYRRITVEELARLRAMLGPAD